MSEEITLLSKYPDALRPKKETIPTDHVLLDTSLVETRGIKNVLNQLVQKRIKTMFTNSTLKTFVIKKKDTSEAKVSSAANYLLEKALDYPDFFEVADFQSSFPSEEEALLEYCLQNPNCGLVTANQMLHFAALGFHIPSAYIVADEVNPVLHFASIRRVPKPKNKESITDIIQKALAEGSSEEPSSEKAPKKVVYPQTVLGNIAVEEGKGVYHHSRDSYQLRRYFYHHDFSSPIQCDAQSTIFLEDGDEIVRLKFEDDDIIRLSHFQFSSTLTDENNALGIYFGKYALDTDFEKEELPKEIFRPLLIEFQKEIRGNLESHTIFQSLYRNGKHYVIPMDNDNHKIIVFNHSKQKQPFGELYLYEVGDQILNLRLLPEDKVEIAHLLVKSTFEKYLIVEPLFWNEAISFTEAFHHITLSDAVVDHTLKAFLEDKVPEDEKWETVPGLDFDNEVLTTKLGLTEDKNEFRCLNVDGSLITSEDTVEVPKDSIIIILRKSKDTLWEMTPYAIKDVTKEFHAKKFPIIEVDLSKDYTSQISFYVKIIDALKEALASRDLLTPSTLARDEIGSIPAAVYVQKNRSLYITLGISKQYVTLFVMKENWQEEQMGKREKLSVGDHLTILIVVNGEYTLSAYTVTQISPDNNAVKQFIASGWVSSDSFQSTQNEELDQFLAKHLSFIAKRKENRLS